ncbi:hypothetical protein AGABI2DRAFT_134586 [Agaricus bisporus var. bisporus H97]|uniref:hypothetical protein n=1 Tax=Agaricus bisporus var. bisporus (strain H97 / ATCC MYA-4626 / FGSC 10389) TaxID=936046 RepID=UPI00029F50F2|nr:hypothetical protein AGABI2DRAFT_134586 [Agaricus bisporus var. bisporus H97]EKV48967.1 hypothetical protein AGABI2DRAFT_134586 [Agaricus bisporus var. bisporus H97]
MFKHRSRTSSKGYKDVVTSQTILVSEVTIGIPKFKSECCKKDRANKGIEMS